MKRVVICLIIMLFAGSGAVFAKKLYKYQDEHGKWHFSDSPPKTERKVEITQLKAENKTLVRLFRRGDETQPEYEAQNDYHGPVAVEVFMDKANNVQADPSLPRRFVIPPMQTKPVFHVGAVNENLSWGYSIRYRFMIGSPEASHDDGYRYLPPLAPNQRFQVTQGFSGEFSHHDAANRYAVDIAMPENTPVHAAREGVVMEVDSDFIKGGTEKPSYANRANIIRILHDDGSMAVYGHLALEKAQVYPGMKVKAGQLIGYSGNTGFTTGPHLHFAVQVNREMQLASVPFQFDDGFGNGFTPEAGMWLKGK
ncbi:MAG: peptidoglycan DD-metalloendopeptidase family protein [Gammaproteobacteria bacterium]